jgi:hypothetical protein
LFGLIEGGKGCEDDRDRGIWIANNWKSRQLSRHDQNLVLLIKQQNAATKPL